jgi:hypothetical protein
MLQERVHSQFRGFDENAVVLLDKVFQLFNFSSCDESHQRMIEHRQHEPEIERRLTIHLPGIVMELGQVFRQAGYG